MTSNLNYSKATLIIWRCLASPIWSWAWHRSATACSCLLLYFSWLGSSWSQQEILGESIFVCNMPLYRGKLNISYVMRTCIQCYPIKFHKNLYWQLTNPISYSNIEVMKWICSTILFVFALLYFCISLNLKSVCVRRVHSVSLP